MNAAGLAIMIVSIGGVLALSAYCLWKVLSLPPVEVEEHIKAPLDIDTRDVENGR